MFSAILFLVCCLGHFDSVLNMKVSCFDGNCAVFLVLSINGLCCGLALQRRLKLVFFVLNGECSEFSDIFDLEHFKGVLAKDVRIVSSLSSTHIMTRPVVERRTPLHVSPQWIRARYLKRVRILAEICNFRVTDVTSSSCFLLLELLLNLCLNNCFSFFLLLATLELLLSLLFGVITSWLFGSKTH